MQVSIDGTVYTLLHRVGEGNGRLAVLLQSGTARHILSDTLNMDLNNGEFCIRVSWRERLYWTNSLAQHECEPFTTRDES